MNEHLKGNRPMPPLINVRRVREGAKLPVYGSDEAAGMDIFALPQRLAGDTTMIAPHSVATVPTGIALDIPMGWCAQVNPRTSLAVKYGIGVLAGLIDSDYRGEIDVILFNITAEPYHVLPGDRIAQLLILQSAYIDDKSDPDNQLLYRWRLVETFKLSETQRGGGRFGSTGKGGDPSGAEAKEKGLDDREI